MAFEPHAHLRSAFAVALGNCVLPTKGLRSRGVIESESGVVGFAKSA
jgi:hypothetical protein